MMMRHILIFDDPMPQSVKGMNKDMPKVPDMVDDDSDCSHNNDSEEEMPDESDDDGYDGCYYYSYGRYERKVSPMIRLESRGWLYTIRDVMWNRSPENLKCAGKILAEE